MKLALFSLILSVVFGWSVSTTQKAQALSCARTTPLVGIVYDVSVNKNSLTKIFLDKAYTFNTSDWVKDETVSIDRYESTVKDYINNNFQLSEVPITERGAELSVPEKSLNEVQIKAGDIVIKGPHFHVCGYRFTGLFTKTGKLKQAIISDNYKNYSYRDDKLEVKAGKKISCGGPIQYFGDACEVEVDFKLAGQSFKLSPGRSYQPTDTQIKSVSLLNSSYTKEGVHDWGLGTYVTYVLDFSDQTVEQATSANVSQTRRPVPQTDNLNFFQKIWRQILAWFR